MSKRKNVETGVRNAATPSPRASGSAGAGAAQPPLDLSLGHIGTTQPPKVLAMDLAKYSESTPGQRAAQRRSAACRPHHPDWAQHNLIQLGDAIAANPYIRAELGTNLGISIQRSDDGKKFAFFVYAERDDATGRSK